jgi:hypothetical protein
VIGDFLRRRLASVHADKCPLAAGGRFGVEPVHADRNHSLAILQFFRTSRALEADHVGSRRFRAQERQLVIRLCAGCSQQEHGDEGKAQCRHRSPFRSLFPGYWNGWMDLAIH